MKKNYKTRAVRYYDPKLGMPITQPRKIKTLLSRLALPLLSLVSREKSIKMKLVPIDDERVIIALLHAKGRVLDVGCGANNFIRSYGNGVGVDVFPWEGCDIVVKDASKLPFPKGDFDTVSFLACLNHIANRKEALIEANRVLKDDGQILITMITPRWGKFIHWIRFSNDPDHKTRHINHGSEQLGINSVDMQHLLAEAGFCINKRVRFVFGLNSLYVAKKIH